MAIIYDSPNIVIIIREETPTWIQVQGHVRSSRTSPPSAQPSWPGGWDPAQASVCAEHGPWRGVVDFGPGRITRSIICAGHCCSQNSLSPT